MSSFQAVIHEDQPERRAYGDALIERLWALHLEHGEGLDAYLAEHREEIVAEAVQKWGLPYAQRLYNMALQRVVIRESLGG